MMRYNTKLLVVVLIFTCCLHATAQLEKGIVLEYEKYEVVIFEHKQNVSLDYIGHKTSALHLNYIDFFTVLKSIFKSLPCSKGDVVQLYFFINEKNEKQLFINLLEKKLAKSVDYENGIIYLCNGDCGKRNELQKIYVYTIESKLLKQFH